MKKLLLLLLILSTSIAHNLTWQLTGRSHSELDWKTIKSENFRVHYHQGLENIAQKGLSYAEQIYPTLLKQSGIKSTPIMDIIFTSEDEILNGFAVWTNQTFIWVDQNDAAVWLEDGKWLYQVLAHELQHLIYFNAVDTWLPEPFGMIYSDVPSWFVEGLAEYMTEKWRPYRGDLYHKIHAYKGKMMSMGDPHMDGYSKLLLLANDYGDSSIVKILNHRDGLGLYSFEDAFKENIGLSIDQFEDYWRRKMNTYFYSYKAQKESYKDLGVTSKLPINSLGSGFKFSPDSLKIAMIGKDNKDQYFQSLIVATQDTSQNNNDTSFSLFKIFRHVEEKDSTDSKKKKSPSYKKVEYDHGRFHQSMSWTSDNSKLAYSKYRFGKNGSMIFDIKVLDLIKKESTWITNNERASYPIWDKDDKKLYYVSHTNSCSNIFMVDTRTLDKKKITNHHKDEDVQILSLSLSPSGKKLAFAMSKENGNLDIYTLNLNSFDNIERQTSAKEVDYLPIWINKNTIVFTSHRDNTTPNLFSVDIRSKEINKITDAFGAVWGIQVAPGGNSIISLTLSDVDSSRVVSIDPSRNISTNKLNIREDYTLWRTKSPDLKLPDFNSDSLLNIEPKEYRFYKYSPKNLMTTILPIPIPFVQSIWMDALGKQLINLSAGAYSWKSISSNFDLSLYQSESDIEGTFYMIDYLNASGGAFWGFTYYKNINLSYREYANTQEGLVENLDGATIHIEIPINFGNDMYSNHSFSSSISFQNRSFIMPYYLENKVKTTYEQRYNELKAQDTNKELLPIPERGKQGVLKLNYSYISKRPYKGNLYLPKNGYGVKLSLDLAHEKLFGEFSFQKFTFDSFSNKKFGLGAFYLRTKLVSLEGDAPNQDYVGLTGDSPLYLPSLGSIFNENMSPRGWSGYKLGSKLIFSTLELRIPIASSLPINFFGFTTGELIATALSDIASTSNSFDFSDDWIKTAGYELKFAIKSGGDPIFIYSYGQAQTFQAWKEKLTPTTYLRFSLVNPF
ncbi:MAG: hypothetical protein CBD58_05060 [bacterium TMED198]|nr:MAG: hypothetical protein CBD58_05060 [bacterium TMED198]